MEKKDSTIMNTHHKPTLARLAALALTLTLLLGLCVNVNAEEEGYTPENPYVLVLRNDKTVYRYAQFSKLVPYVKYDGNQKFGFGIVFGLMDETKNRAFESLYCVDFPVDDGDGNVGYQRLNLGDSTYAAALADKLRGIVLNTYPNITVDELANSSGVNGLTRSEAITASQLAIWKTAHGDTIQIVDFVGYIGGNGGTSDIQSELDAEGEAFRLAKNSGDVEYQNAVKGRIEALYNYLLSLPEQKPSKIVASNASFVEKHEPIVTANQDGTYSIRVTTKVRVTLDEGDSLTLSAHLDDTAYYASATLEDGEKEYNLTIKNVPAELANGTVYLAIDGNQYGNDVYFIDANGIRGVSQSMIGVLDGTYPVHADIKCEPDRVLNIYKTEKVTDDNGNETRLPLANISFNVYYVGSVEDFRDGKPDIGSKPTDADIANYAKTSNLVGTVTTDEDGRGSLNLHTEDGVYLVKELPNEAVEDASVAFFVSLPDWSRLDENGNPTYEITAEPKNTVSSEDVDIEKDVTEIDNKHDTYDVGEDHPWIIRTTIPKTIATGKSYIITDTLDYRLTYKSLDKVELVNTVTESAEAVLLTGGTDYTVTVGQTTDSDGHTVDAFTVSLTTVGMQKIAKAVGDDHVDYELRTWFTAQINSNAQMGENIPNQAEIVYTNNVGKTFTDTSNQPEVHTGGAQLNKVNANGDTLAGAEFEVYREATDADLKAGVSYITVTIGETERKLIKVSFYDNAQCAGEKVESVTTGVDGVAYIYGLAYGEYYLVETKAPDGYNKLASPVKFTVGENSHEAEHAVTVVNTTGTVLPSTGGIGTVPFTVMGLLLLAAAAVLLGRKKQRA